MQTSGVVEMKNLLLFACVVAIAAAEDLLQQAAPALDENVDAFLRGAADAGALSRALGTDDVQTDLWQQHPDRRGSCVFFCSLQRDIEEGFGAAVRGALQGMLLRIAAHVRSGEGAAEELFRKTKELREKLVDGEKTTESIAKVRAKAKETLRNILERLGLGKRNLDDSMDHVARMRFTDIVELIRDEVVSPENMQKIRDYIKNYPNTSPLFEAFRRMVGGLSNAELSQLLRELLESGMLPMEGAPLLLLGDPELLRQRARKFGGWVHDMWAGGMGKLKDKYGTIKATAMEFVSRSKDASSGLSRKALEFFRPYRDELGALWTKLAEAAREAVGRF